MKLQKINVILRTFDEKGNVTREETQHYGIDEGGGLTTGAVGFRMEQKVPRRRRRSRMYVKNNL